MPGAFGSKRVLLATLIILLSALGSALGQGGTGREPTPPPPPKKTTTTNTTRKPPAKKPARSTTSGSKTSQTSSPANLPRTRTNQAGMEFVLILPGSFMMGSTNGDEDEKPAHQVKINYSFYMSRYEVTQAQWQAVKGNNTSFNKACGGNCPVEMVSWNDAQEFIEKPLGELPAHVWL